VSCLLISVDPNTRDDFEIDPDAGRAPHRADLQHPDRSYLTKPPTLSRSVSDDDEVCRSVVDLSDLSSKGNVMTEATEQPTSTESPRRRIRG
jgi:hypothetical protein